MLPEPQEEFVVWLRQVGFRSEVSSAYNPASNGLAEVGVKNVKVLLKKCLGRKEGSKSGRSRLLTVLLVRGWVQCFFFSFFLGINWLSSSPSGAG